MKYQGRESQKRAKVTLMNEIALLGEDERVGSNLWLGDSGATSHMICSKTGLIAIKSIDFC
jgi:hypothetical protein